MGYRASVQNSEGRPGDPPDLPSSRKPNRSAHLRRLPRLLHADHPDASAPRPRPGTDRAKRARKVRRRPNDRRPSAHDRRPRDRADPLHPTRARAATPDEPAQTHLAVAAAPQNHRRRPGPVPIPVVKTFEAKSLIQHAADSRFWPNPRRRARRLREISASTWCFAGTGLDGVIPLGMEGVAFDVEGRHFGGADSDALFIGIGVEFAAARPSRLGCGRRDQLDAAWGEFAMVQPAGPDYPINDLIA